MKSEKTKHRTSLYLGILSLVTGVTSFVIGLMGLPDGEMKVFDVPLEYRAFLWFILAVLGILAVITGLISKFKVGQFLGAIGALLCTLFCFLTFVVVGHALASSATYRQSMEILSNAIQEYCEQNEGALPGADAWCDQLLKSAENKDEADSMRFALVGMLYGNSSEKMSRFSFNKNLDGYRLSDIDHPTVLLFETDSGWNQNGTLATLPSRTYPGLYPLIERGSLFVFVMSDSTFTVEFVKDSELDSLNWEPAK